jgi:2-succinyl-5-enolpyruvyl-6-hydroxy-3-cyclohexene-1-carboxylate synthase
MPKTSTLYNARLLVFLLKEHGVKNILVSPGSRNAPLIIALRSQGFNLYSIPDERSAAFTALGMALSDGIPAAVICTSGSAAANYLPAATEAFYQKVPLLMLTADRPKEWIGQGAGQTIMQENIFGSHVLYSANLLREPQDDLARNYNQRITNEALIKSFKGPVHINIPFDEPLYDTQEWEQESFRVIKQLGSATLNTQEWEALSKSYQGAKKILLIAGQMSFDEALKDVLIKFVERPGILLFTETLSNLSGVKGIHAIDRLVNTITDEQKEFLQADLVISFGGEIVSKMLKSYLKTHQPKAHWNLSEDDSLKDSFHALTLDLKIKPRDFFEKLETIGRNSNSNWSQKIVDWDFSKLLKHKKYLELVPFSDFKVFDYILKALPANSMLHCANSASIRYSQLFNHDMTIRHYANRGTSGIDGSTSTSVGHAQNTDQNVTLITGDIAYLYDSAAFWNDRLPENLKIIVLNNQGGNIFRIIKGPSDSADFERLQETKHELNLSGPASAFNIPYQQINKEEDIAAALEELYQQKGMAILELKTPSLESPQVLKNYFEFLKSTEHDF